MKTNTRYPDGYLNKIQYWNLQLTDAIGCRDFKAAGRATTKLTYFLGKQQDLIDAGYLVPGQTGTMSPA